MTPSTEPTPAQHGLRAHLRAIMENELPFDPPDEQDAHTGHSCVSSDETVAEEYMP